MRKVIAAIVLSLLSACASQAPYRNAENASGYVAPVPAYYDWPLVYRTQMFPGWYVSNPYSYAYWGFPSPWGFYYYSPNFYPYHFWVAYSLWPDFYGGWYDPRFPWRPPYRGYWHPHPVGAPAPVAAASPGVSGAYGARGAYRTRAPGRPAYRAPGAKPKAIGGLDALYGKGVDYHGRSASGAYPGKQGFTFPAPSKAGRVFAPPSALPAPPASAPATPAGWPKSPAKARNPAGRPVNPAKPFLPKH